MEHYRRQQLIVTAAIAAARKMWAAGNVIALTALVTQLQQQAAADASQSVPLMLAEQGAAAASVASVLTSAFSGIASDGRGLASLFEQATTRRTLDLMVATQIQDAARVAAGVAIATRPDVSGYVRMLNPPSCSRCVVLAGKWFRWNTGFERHPKCDCRHVPMLDRGMYRELGLVDSPDEYFRSLSTAEQDAAFGKAGAQALRDGADFSQVVNARSGMSTASVGGRQVKVTSSGTTKRGYFAYVQRAVDQQRGQGTPYTARNVGRRGAVANYVERRVKRRRLMPEQIYAIAGNDRTEALRLLALNGYITGGRISDIAGLASRY